MYKVLKEVVEEDSSGKSARTSVPILHYFWSWLEQILVLPHSKHRGHSRREGSRPGWQGHFEEATSRIVRVIARPLWSKNRKTFLQKGKEGKNSSGRVHGWNQKTCKKVPWSYHFWGLVYSKYKWCSYHNLYHTKLPAKVEGGLQCPTAGPDWTSTIQSPQLLRARVLANSLIVWNAPVFWDSEVDCLHEHEDPLDAGYEAAQEKAALPISSVDEQELLAFLETSKKDLKPIDDDVKDARRRITAAKGPKKKRQTDPEEVQSEGEESVDSQWFSNNTKFESIFWIFCQFFDSECESIDQLFCAQKEPLWNIHELSFILEFTPSLYFACLIWSGCCSLGSWPRKPPGVCAQLAGTCSGQWSKQITFVTLGCEKRHRCSACGQYNCDFHTEIIGIRTKHFFRPTNSCVHVGSNSSAVSLEIIHKIEHKQPMIEKSYDEKNKPSNLLTRQTNTQQWKSSLFVLTMASWATMDIVEEFLEITKAVARMQNIAWFDVLVFSAMLSRSLNYTFQDQYIDLGGFTFCAAAEDTCVSFTESRLWFWPTSCSCNISFARSHQGEIYETWWA